ncbi:hypothetical protein Trihar35433_5565 [Trichoderma harzianum]|nr:hypothetical protein Trihar35433_5565 [Trichoderma harzianum]
MMASGTVIGTPELDWSVTAARDVPAGARTARLPVAAGGFLQGSSKLLQGSHTAPFGLPKHNPSISRREGFCSATRLSLAQPHPKPLSFRPPKLPASNPYRPPKFIVFILLFHTHFFHVLSTEPAEERQHHRGRPLRFPFAAVRIVPTATATALALFTTRSDCARVPNSS